MTADSAPGPIRAALALKSVRWLLAAALLVGIVLSFIPLLAVHGIESAVALGALLPPLCAAGAARIAIAARNGPALGAVALAGRAVTAGLLLLLAPVLVLALNALRVRNCAPLEGLTFIALGPGAGVVLAALVGACAGALPVRPWIATALAVLVPLLGVLRAFYGFYATPTVYAYGHFFGYFPGALYDELVELPGPLLTQRVLTALWCAALIALLVSHYEPTRRALALWPQPGRRGAQAVLVAAACAALIGAANGEQLGHRSSVRFIADALGERVLSRRCELVIARETPSARRQRMADDCDFRVRQMERWFGLSQRERVRVFVFRNADEKRKLMGAASTNIAKPWRREIYLQDDAWPHPVLAHEMAHIVAGNTGRGPFRVAGPLGGLWPDFALVEGVAVAAAWVNSSPSGLTPHQWTRAMIEQDLAPPLSQLFGAGFLQQQRRVAYTLAGSALQYIAQTHGTRALRRIYAGEDVRAVLGISLEELDRRFRAFIAAVPLPDAARALAQQRFAGSSILSSVCPHEKAKLARELEGDLAAGDAAEAEDTCRRVLAIDPAETGVRATLAAVLARQGDLAAARAELERLQRPQPAAPTVIAAARQMIADEAWRSGKPDAALAIYRELLGQPSDRDVLRMLQVKTLALAGSARERELIFALLVGEPARAVDGAVAVYLLRELRAEREDGLPHYLEARQLLNRERFAEAASLLGEARQHGLPTPEIALEAVRIEAIARYAAGDIARSAELWHQLAASSQALALQAEAREWLQRIRFADR
jgi:thioredoxin-like negative regulator of GroEL